MRLRDTVKAKARDPGLAEAHRWQPGRGEVRLDRADHWSLALWAAGCAEHVLRYCEAGYPEDGRPRMAVEAGRAAAHAATTAHVAGHAAHAAGYAVTAAAEAAGPADPAAEQRGWQYRRLPEHLRVVVFPARGDH